MHKSFEFKLFNIIAKIFIGILATICVVPFLMIVSGSISSEDEILRHGYSILPRGLSFEAYKFLIENPTKIINAYGTSVLVTFMSCAISITLITMTAYVLFRDDFKYRNSFAFFFYFTTIFNGGLLPMYILMVRYLHLKDNIFALILPGAFNIFYLLIMRNFMKSTIPKSLIEAAKIDGSGDFFIYWRIVLPLMVPALATVGLFEVIGYWNNWANAMLYMNTESKFPLQYVLYRILQAASNVASEGAIDSGTTQRLPSETLKLAMTVVAIGPIIFAYPFVQKYFVQGITVGAVKG